MVGLVASPLRASTRLTFARSEGRSSPLSLPSRTLPASSFFQRNPYRSRARSELGSVACPPLSEFGARPPAFPTHLTDYRSRISFSTLCVPRFHSHPLASCHSALLSPVVLTSATKVSCRQKFAIEMHRFHAHDAPRVLILILFARLDTMIC